MRRVNRERWRHADAGTVAADRLERLRQAKIEHFHSAVRPHLDVRGFEIAVDDPELVCAFECLDDLPGNRERFVEREWATRNAISKRGAFDQFHDQRAPSGEVFDAVDLRDVGMIERRQDLCLTLETGEAVSVRGEEVGQYLERDVASELRIARPIHFPHAAGAQQRQHLVGTHARTG